MTTLLPLSDEPLGYPGDDDGTQRVFFDARQTVISQYANSPILLALIDALNDALDRQAQFDDFYNTVWNIDTAVGFGLDIWGRIVGVSRALHIDDEAYLGFAGATGVFPFGSGIFHGSGDLTPNYRLTDEAFRRLIMAKAALNITSGSIPAVNAILMALFPSYGNVYVRDNADMTISFVFSLAPSKVDYAIVTQSGVMPRAIGVLSGIESP